MNEVEWLTGGDPLLLLDHVEGQLSDRRLRLMACACVRRFWGTVRNERCRRVVETAEGFAEKRARRRDLRQAREAAADIAAYPPEFEAFAFEAAVATADDRARDALRHVLDASRRHAGRQAAYEAVFDEASEYAAGLQQEQARQCELIRTFVANPFRPVTVQSAWVRANDRAVGKVAEQITNNHQYADLPYLQDALIDAGCDEEVLLRACREPGRSVLEGGYHWDGFWVLDALLGRE